VSESCGTARLSGIPREPATIDEDMVVTREVMVKAVYFWLVDRSHRIGLHKFPQISSRREKSKRPRSIKAVQKPTQSSPQSLTSLACNPPRTTHLEQPKPLSQWSARFAPLHDLWINVLIDRLNSKPLSCSSTRPPALATAAALRKTVAARRSTLLDVVLVVQGSC